MTTRKWSDPQFEVVALVLFSVMVLLAGCLTTEQREKIASMIPAATETPLETPVPTAIHPQATPVPAAIISAGDKRADLCARFGATYVDGHVVFDGLSVDTRNRLFVSWCSERMGDVMPVTLNGNDIFMRCK
jgi:hypothetical protein